MKNVSYIRCPRCELNFIQKKDKYCSVCKAELSAQKDEFVDDLDLDLCPICKTNYIHSDEVMCPSCMKECGGDEENEDIIQKKANDDEWEAYVQQDEDGFTLPNEETGDLAIVDLDDADELDEDDLSLVDSEFDDEEEDEDDDEEEEKDEDEDEDDEDDDDEDEDDEDDDDFDDYDFDDDDDDDDDKPRKKKRV